ncbi:MAG TPA: DAK2 domain-containing protein [Acidimicrobiales bacterium]
MSTLDHLGAAEVRGVIEAYRVALAAHREPINRLNVYPVPDGDTGTNMSLTLGSVADEIAGVDDPDDLGQVCKAISKGSLMGARGNSGVILSQILRGMADVVAQAGGLDAPTMARALRSASDAAYQAVMRPVEGTILTVVRAAAESAEATLAADATVSLVDLAAATRAAAQAALEGTPELLPVLKEAGVVDAGGTGFVLLLDALLNVVDGREIPAPAVGEGTVRSDAALVEHTADDHAAHEGVGDLRYEVMYFLEAPDDTIPAFKDVWAGIGDSIVVVGGDGLWNCHIHTDDIGAAIEAALDAGRPRNIRVTDLMEQVEEERWVREAGAESTDDVPVVRDRVTTAVVAVAAGQGVKRIFHSLGAQGIVAGGQSMNPSTAELLDMVEGVNADQVVILPNNKNIIPVAEQVDALTDKVVRVIPTRGVAEGFAALMGYDPEAPVEDNAKEMAELASAVVAGEVTQAVRDSTSEVGPIAKGDFLGIARDGIKVVAATVAEAAVGLLEVLVADGHEIVTIIEGEGSTAADTRRITEWLAEHRASVSCEVHHGGQPLYPYLFGVE